MTIIKQALNPDINVTGAGTSATTLIKGSPDNGVTEKFIATDSNGKLLTVTTNDYEELVWVDSTGTYFIRTVIVDETGTPVIAYVLADGTPYVPVGATVPASSGTDRKVNVTHFIVNTAGTGYSVGDLVDMTTIIDVTLSSVVANIYYNLSTQAVITPTFAHLSPLETELSMTNATAVLSYTHASVLAVDTPSATLLTVGATGASHLQVLNNTGAILEIGVGLTNPVRVGMGGNVNMDLNIPAGATITITPRIVGLGATDYVTINVS